MRSARHSPKPLSVDDDHRGEGILFGFPEDSGVHRGKPFSGWEDERTGS